MLVIRREDVDSYRYAVAKACFLSCYQQYELYKDINKSNCMIVNIRRDKSIRTFISLFSEPSIKTEKITDNITVFYQRSKNDNKQKKYLYEQLSKDFNSLYSEQFFSAVLDSDEFIKDLNDRYLIFFRNIILSEKDFEGKSCFK